MRRNLILLLFLLSSLSVLAQEETDFNRDFIYRGRHYVPHSPWWTVGLGYGFNMGEQTWEPNFLLDVHFRVKKKHWLGVGFVTSRSEFLDKNGPNIFLPHSYVKNSVNSFHALYGWRREKLFNNFGAFVGPSYNWGFDYVYSDSTGDYHQGYSEAGIYASLQYSRKFYYDLGIGATLWTNINKSYQIVGLTLHFYFSTAFKRDIL